ncbi:unnamed protein product [Camellia sinensis]
MCPKLVQVRSQESLLVLHGLVGSRSLYTNNTWLGHIVFVLERKKEWRAMDFNREQDSHGTKDTKKGCTRS